MGIWRLCMQSVRMRMTVMLSQNDLAAIEAAFAQQIQLLFSVYCSQAAVENPKRGSPEAVMRFKNGLTAAKEARQLAMKLMEEIEG